MMNTLTGSAGVLSLRGIIAILFGMIALFWPGITLFAFVISFAIFAIINGIVLFISSIKNRKNQDLWGLTLIFGFISFVVGVYLVSRPAVAAVIMSFLIAGYALAIGIFDIAAGISMHNELPGRWAIVIVGVLSLIFAGYIFFNPIVGIMAVLWVLGIYFIIKGMFLLGLGISAAGVKTKRA